MQRSGFHHAISTVLGFLLFTVTFTPLLSEAIVLTDSTPEVPIGLDADYLEDPAGKLTIENLTSQLREPNWEKSKQKAISFPVSKSAYWIRFAVKNESSRSDWVLESSYPHLDNISFFLPGSQGKFIEKRSGRMFPFSSREFKHKNVVFSMNLATRSEAVFYVRVLSQSSLNCALSIWQHETLNEKAENEKFYLGLYFGIMLIMAMYNFSLFLSIGDKAYLLYVIYVLCLVSYHLVLEGLMLQYVMPNYPVLVRTVTVPLGGSIGITAMLFAVLFLRLKTYAPMLRHTMWLCATIFGGGGILVSFISYPVGLKVTTLFALTFPVILLVAGLLTLRRGYKPAKYFLFAWTVLIIAIIIFSLRLTGRIEPSFITEHGMELGSALEVLLLSLALGDRINLMKEEKEKAQTDLLELAKEQNLTLERKVLERTQALGETLKAVQNDLAVARKVQLATLSNLQNFKSLVDLHGVYSPVNEVGGDVFNVHLVRPDLVRIFLADATGHGVQAALVTMTIVSLYEGLKAWEETPDAVLFALNGAFMKSYRSLNTFFTAGILDLHLETGLLRYAGGGNPYPRIVKENGESEIIESKGAMLGLRDSHSCQLKETTLSHGMSLYLFTDGVFEELNPAGEEFNVERLEQILIENRNESLSHIADTVIGSLQEFRSARSKNDDMTFLGVRRL